MYEYKATIVRITDADTLVILADLGFHIHQEMPLRLFGINAPEIRGTSRPAGLVAKAFVESVLPVGTTIRVKTYKDAKEKYGRYLAEIFYGNADVPTCLNQELVEKGLAVAYLD